MRIYEIIEFIIMLRTLTLLASMLCVMSLIYAEPWLKK